MKKERLVELINEHIAEKKTDTEYLEYYKKVIEIPTEEIIINKIISGDKCISINGQPIIEVNEELLIRMYLKD